MKIVVLLIVVLATMFQGIDASACCQDDWIAYRNHCYYIGTKPQTFMQAHYFCTQRGANLTRIDDYKENHFLQNLLRKNKVSLAWIGLTDQSSEGIWRWYDSEELASFTDWGLGEPNNWLNREHCVVLWNYMSYKWNDCPCGDEFRYICEK